MITQCDVFSSPEYWANCSGCQCNQNKARNLIEQCDSESVSLNNTLIGRSVIDNSCQQFLSTTEANKPFVETLNALLLKYTMRASINTRDSCVAMSGGLQQLLNKQKNVSKDCQPRRGCGSELTTFHDLPVRFCFHLFLIDVLFSYIYY